MKQDKKEFRVTFSSHMELDKLNEETKENKIKDNLL